MNPRARRILTIVALIVIGLAGFLTVDRLVGLWGFKRVLRQQSLATAEVQPFDERCKAFLDQMENDWRARVEEGSPSISEVLTAFGFVPSVQNVVRILASEPPGFSWLFPLENRRSLALGGIRSTYMTLVPDHTVYISEDGHLALMWWDMDGLVDGVLTFEDATDSVVPQHVPGGAASQPSRLPRDPRSLAPARRHSFPDPVNQALEPLGRPAEPFWKWLRWNPGVHPVSRAPFRVRSKESARSWDPGIMPK